VSADVIARRAYILNPTENCGSVATVPIVPGAPYLRQISSFGFCAFECGGRFPMVGERSTLAQSVPATSLRGFENVPECFACIKVCVSKSAFLVREQNKNIAVHA
jgi:hypothetical protein